MKLEKLTIRAEDGSKIEALFNPNKLVIGKSVNWEEQQAKERDVPELQFKNGQPRTLSIDLIFDTYDTPEAGKESVREKYTDKLFKLTMVNSTSTDRRSVSCPGAARECSFKGYWTNWISNSHFSWKMARPCARRANARLRNGAPIQTTRRIRIRRDSIFRHCEDVDRKARRQSQQYSGQRVFRRAPLAADCGAKRYR